MFLSPPLSAADQLTPAWRRLWIALAESEKELGLDITQEQIDELIAHKDDINYDVAKKREAEVRHGGIVYPALN